MGNSEEQNSKFCKIKSYTKIFGAAKRRRKRLMESNGQRRQRHPRTAAPNKAGPLPEETLPPTRARKVDHGLNTKPAPHNAPKRRPTGGLQIQIPARRITRTHCVKSRMSHRPVTTRTQRSLHVAMNFAAYSVGKHMPATNERRRNTQSTTTLKRNRST